MITKEASESRILIADDIPRNLQLLGSLLTKEGYKIAAVTKGEQVISTVEKFDPDLILLDVMMPDKNGFEVCKELQANANYVDIPVIFLTGKAEQEDVIEGLEIGGSDYITKPFNTQELLIRVQTHVALKQSRDQIREQNDQLAQVNATRDKLYSVIGHDLKNALFGASGFANLLINELEETSSIPDSVMEKAEFIQTSTQQMSRLLENLLDWARLQTGNLIFEAKEFSVERAIDEAIHVFQSTGRIKGVDIKYDGPSEAKAVGDRRIMATIIRNLISNAIKYSTKGDQVEVSLKSEDSVYTIAVRDQGIGMEKEIKENLFNPENRPIQSGTQNEKGTGLGLILCKDLIEKSGGSIQVESTPSSGTTITITFLQK